MQEGQSERDGKKREEDVTPQANRDSEEFDLMEVVAARAKGRLEEKLAEYDATHPRPKSTILETPISRAHDPDAAAQPTRRDRNIKEANVERAPRAPGEALQEEEAEEEEEFDIMKVVRLRARAASYAVGGKEEEKTEAVVHETEEVPAQIDPLSKPGVPFLGAEGYRPGAYLGSPGASLHRCDDPRFSQVGVQARAEQPSLRESSQTVESGEASSESFLAPQTRTHMEMELQSANLVQAMPIISELDQASALTEAQALDPKKLDQKEQDGGNEKKWQWGIFAFLLLLLALSLGFSFARSKEDIVPTVSPSAAPSNPPSSEPTQALESLLRELPDSTLDMIYNSSSHQRSAFEWMLSKTEIRGMEGWRLKQIFALATFYFSFGGPQWPEDIRDDWLEFSDVKSECHWYSSEFGFFTDEGYVASEEIELYGIKPCNENGEFQALLMHSLGVDDYNPMLPPELAFLTKLRVISLFGNDLDSSLMDLLQGLLKKTNLSVLDLSLSGMSGAIPTELGLFTALSVLDLSYNSISGTIPTQMGLLTNLSRMQLNNNALAGGIPTELGLIQSLQVLHLMNNILSGTIPTEVGLQTNLLVLALEENSLTGAIPTEIALQTSLQFLTLSNNSLVGTIPSELGTLVSNWDLREVDLYANQLSGIVPNELCAIGSSYHFDCVGPLCGCHWCGCGLLGRNDTMA